MFRIIRYSLSRRWVQSVSTLLAVTVSVGILLALYLLYTGVSLGLESGSKRLGADLLVIPADAWVEPENVLFTGAPMNMYMDANLEGKVAGIPGVAKVTSQFFTQTLNADCCSLANATRLIGFDLHSDRLILSLLRKKGELKLSSDEIVIGPKVDGSQGGYARVLNKSFRIAAILEPTGTSLDYCILMPIDAARQLAKDKENRYLAIYWERFGPPEQLISAMLVQLDERGIEEDIVRAIDNLGKVKVIEPAGVLKNIKAQMESLFLVILGGGLLTVACSFFNLFSRFFSMAWDRKGEWGLYRALGATRGDLKMLVVGEALILNLCGVFLGIVAGALLYGGILTFLRKQRAFPFIEPSLPAVFLGIAGILVAFSLVGLFSAWVPARRSGRIEPSAAMALEDID